MKPWHIVLGTTAIGLLFVPLASATTLPSHRLVPVDKALVADGHVQHDLGALWNNVTNFGLIGSMPGAGTPFSQAPSGRWPGSGDVDNLWAAGLWVGARVAGETLVTTGVYSFEMQATDAPPDTIYPMAMGQAGGNRYPGFNADDDGDGLEDEDPPNGVDDDDDGLIDEDFGGIGDQSFRCVYSDTAAIIQEVYPDHQPLGISVIQQSFQWNEPLAGDFIGYDFTVTNVGENILDQVYLGLFSDFDMGTGPGSPGDDFAGSWTGSTVTGDGTSVPVSLAYMWDEGGYAGWVLCGYSGVGDCGSTIQPINHSMEILAGNDSFANGGDPTNDGERYAALSSGNHDPDTVREGDYRTLMASGPFDTLEPGRSLVYRVALVAGADLPSLIQAAGEAVRTAQGFCFDRDGDPSHGEEFHVPWLRPEDVPVAAASGHLAAYKTDGGVTLQVATALGVDEPLALVRRAQEGLAERRWSPGQWTRTGFSSEGDQYSVTDDDAGSWPRTYDLVLASPGKDDLVLDTLIWGADSLQGLWLRAGPNPFNPALTVDYQLGRGGQVSLDVFDLAGRCIKKMVAGPMSAGSHQVTWHGQDDAGRQVPSGVYLLRLATEEGVINRRVTMVR